MTLMFFITIFYMIFFILLNLMIINFYTLIFLTINLIYIDLILGRFHLCWILFMILVILNPWFNVLYLILLFL